MHVYIYIYIYVCVYEYMCLYMYRCIRAYMYVLVFVFSFKICFFVINIHHCLSIFLKVHNYIYVNNNYIYIHRVRQHR